MFEQEQNKEKNLASDFINPKSQRIHKKEFNLKSLIIKLAIALLSIILILVIYFIFFKTKPSLVIEGDEETLDKIVNLGDGTLSEANNLESLENWFRDLGEVEYLLFSDFYRLADLNQESFSARDYELPINVKTDLENYYDVSRKIDLNASIDELNQYGFASLNNPWAKEANDFYSIANLIESKDIPLYISSDFILYFYQNTLKRAYKEVEEGIFYDSLWEISKNLFNKARLKYEVQLAKEDDLDKVLLEAKRLETAFFAITLELLRPKEEQVDSSSSFSSNKFSQSELRKYSFSLPSYLKDDVLRELNLIKSAREKGRSPVLLYNREYSDFQIPAEYKTNARLNNFYLASAWLSSVFPLNYRDDTCPDCLLDEDDWKINFLSSLMIAQDFSQDQNLKNNWARIYKLISYFQGLRDNWTHLEYSDSFYELFGAEASLEDIFSINNEAWQDNLFKFKNKLLEREFILVQGGLDVSKEENYKELGFKFLSDYFPASQYIFSSFTYPNIETYLGNKNDKLKTSCTHNYSIVRCQASAYDLLTILDQNYLRENSNQLFNYENYTQVSASLGKLAQLAMLDNLNNFWSSMFVWQKYLKTSESHLPKYMQSEQWLKQRQKTILGAWLNLELDPDRLSLRSTGSRTGQSLGFLNSLDHKYFIEPNLDLVLHLKSQNEMILAMFLALGMDEYSSLAIKSLREIDYNLEEMAKIIRKTFKQEALSDDDNLFIQDFIKSYVLDSEGSKTLYISNKETGARMRESLGQIKLLGLVHPDTEGKLMFSIGPIFNFQE